MKPVMPTRSGVPGVLAASIALALGVLTAQACGQRIEGPSRIFDDGPQDAPPASGYRVEVVLENLAHPWAIAWLPDGSAVITERGGRLLLARPDGDGGYRTPVPVEGVPQAAALGQGGLMDVAVHPRFADNGWIYLTLATGTPQANRTVLVRGRLVVPDEGPPSLEEATELFRAVPDKPGGQHFGSRLLWLPDGTLLMSVGDGGNPPIRAGGRLTRDNAQHLDNALGKVLRFHEDGSAPSDNPFADRQDVGRFVYTYGHRNIQGLALDPASGQVWATEHGARGGDELNLLTPGGNYGWPKATYSVEYRGGRISPHASLPGMIDPACVWTPVLAASGLAFYTGQAFPQWQGDLLAGGLISRQVRVVLMQGENVQANQTIAIGQRVRDVRQGPDGLIYLLTDQIDGRLLRLVPSE